MGKNVPENARVLIIKPSSLGDIVHTLPVAHALKRCRPGITLGWVVQKPFLPLVAADPAVDRVYGIDIPSTSEPGAGQGVWWRAGRATVSALLRLRRQWRRDPHDLILDLHGSLRSGLIGRMNPGGTRIGFADARELNPLFQDERIVVPREVVHAQAKNLLFCDHLGCTATDEDFFLHCPGEDRRVAAEFLRGRDVDTAGLVYGNPAARWRSKFWLAERWAELGDRLAERGLILVLGGSAGDQALAREIADRMRARPLIAAGRLDLLQSAALIQMSRCYVGVDTGPMHMAALSGIPVVALFGPTHPERVGPWRVRHRVVQADGMTCLRCRKRECPDPACMRGISVDMVLAAMDSVLAPETETDSMTVP